MSQFWILLKRDDGGGADNWSYGRAKLQPNCHKPTFTVFYRPEDLSIGQPTVSKYRMENYKNLIKIAEMQIGAAVIRSSADN